jgi:hypothetical protein
VDGRNVLKAPNAGLYQFNERDTTAHADPPTGSTLSVQSLVQ